MLCNENVFQLHFNNTDSKYSNFGTVHNIFNIDVCKSCSIILAEGNKMLLPIKQILYLKKDIRFIFTIKILCFFMYKD